MSHFSSSSPFSSFLLLVTHIAQEVSHHLVLCLLYDMKTQFLSKSELPAKLLVQQIFEELNKTEEGPGDVGT